MQRIKNILMWVFPAIALNKPQVGQSVSHISWSNNIGCKLTKAEGSEVS